MARRRTQPRDRRQYRRPFLRRRRRLSDVAEGVNIFVTGRAKE